MQCNLYFFIDIKLSKYLSAKYYQEKKRKTTKNTPERYQNLSKEEKEEKQQYCLERYKNLSENEKK